MQSAINLRKDIHSLTFPIFIELLLVNLMGATDTFMLSQYSDDAVAAVGVANQLIVFAFLIFQIINIGTTVMCSQYLGAGHRDKMEQVTAMALMLNTVSGIIVSVVLSAGAPVLLRWMGLKDDLMQYGLPYMQIAGSCAIFQSLHLTVSASLRADHKVKYPMMVALMTNFVNIAGNYIFIFGHCGMPALGVEGAAIATSVSRFVAAVLLFCILLRCHIPLHRLVRAYRAPMKQLASEMGKLLRIGMPGAGENMSFNAQQVMLTYFINMLGNEALTARMYVVSIVTFAYIFCICIAQGTGIVIGHLIGNHRYRASYKVGWYALRLAVLITVGMSVLYACIGKQLFGLLTDNPEIVALGCTVLMIDIVVEMGKATNIFYTYVLRSAGDIYFPFIIGIPIQWVVGVGMGWLFGIGLGWGLEGVWCALILDECIRGSIFIWRWKSKRWMQKALI